MANLTTMSGGGFGAGQAATVGAAVGAGGNQLAEAAPLPIGAYLAAGFISIALSDTQIAPLIAGFLGAAIVYNGIRVIAGGKSLGKTATQIVTPPTPIIA